MGARTVEGTLIYYENNSGSAPVILVMLKVRREAFENEMDVAGANRQIPVFSGIPYAYTDQGADAPGVAVRDEPALRQTYASTRRVIADAFAGVAGLGGIFPVDLTSPLRTGKGSTLASHGARPSTSVPAQDDGSPMKPRRPGPPLTKAELRAQGDQAVAAATRPIVKLPTKLVRQCGRCGEFSSVMVEPGAPPPEFKCKVCDRATK